MDTIPPPVLPFIQTQLKQFDVNEAELVAMADEFKNLAVADVEDRLGLAKVHESRIILKNKRVEIEKMGLQLRSQATAFNKAVIARENHLVAIIAPTEQMLQKEETRIAAEKERLRLAEEQAEAARVQARIDALHAVGAAHDLHELTVMPEEYFQDMLRICTANFNKAKQEAEEARLRQEQIDRAEAARFQKMKADQEAERQRLDALRKEQEAQAEQLRQERLLLDQERERLDTAKRKEEEEKKRLADLENIRKEAAEKERLRLEKERVDREFAEEQAKIKREQERSQEEAERPDREKLVALGKRILAVLNESPVQLKTAAAQRRLVAARDQITDAVTQFLTFPKKK